CASDKGPPSGGGETPPPEDDGTVFPQGLASGDPRSDSVILWTRVEPTGNAAKDVKVSYEVAKDKDLKTVVAPGGVTASADAGHTVHLKVTKLEPRTTYYYRFTAEGVRTELGRTKTAPAEDDDAPVTFAFACCQDFVGRYYYAWKTLADDDAVDFVLHLGDYI